MKIKKIVLVSISLLMYLLFIFYQAVAPQGFCDVNNFILCSYQMDALRNIFNFFPVIIIFTLLTSILPQAVFAAWWKFTRLGIPLVFGLVIVINLRLHHTPGGFLNLDSAVDTLLVGIIFGIFIFGSLVQIARAWFKGNNVD